jgi:hypothetical protein
MSKTMMNSFVKQFIAEVKGDDVEAQAEKVWRQANYALKSYISSMEGDLIEKEDRVTEAQEKLTKARINRGIAISDRNSYITGLIVAKEGLKKAQKELDAHIATIEFLKEEWENLKQEVK